MELSDKIAGLRKSLGMSQQNLAEKLNISRQAVSRWEMGSAMPDAANILQLSKLFGVTTDYLLNDDYENVDEPSKVQETKTGSTYHIFMILVFLEIMTLLVQFITTCILQNEVLGFLGFFQFACIIGGFELGYWRKKNKATENAVLFRKRFYKTSAWLGLYFPIRFFMTMFAGFYPRPYSVLAFHFITAMVYLGTALLVTSYIERSLFGHP